MNFPDFDAILKSIAESNKEMAATRLALIAAVADQIDESKKLRKTLIELIKVMSKET